MVPNLSLISSNKADLSGLIMKSSLFIDNVMFERFTFCILRHIVQIVDISNVHPLKSFLRLMVPIIVALHCFLADSGSESISGVRERRKSISSTCKTARKGSRTDGLLKEV